ncbi:KOW domain-containing RNA-binding protein [Irregularibacter muris]|jgi:ribosomal protein L14E/L6E/L27E|uniref:KOW domain-containing RNA-binding protein n=1 Tax=Irregularibacter muris TaxID=1796619 RepID=A0AAE3HDM6_9FIRM|nr:KOW domain-containing RNA-binding protein [Irregularibacter muris]MCR1898645.1 KOW domain-containing RNA-binding protein [Irregularibacter muris]
MESNDLLLGQVVYSLAGRDKGKFMVVMEKIDSQYVHISDGDIRKVDKAKKKKVKHLRKTNHIISTINKKLETGQKINNAEIRKKLKELGYNTQNGKRED